MPKISSVSPVQVSQIADEILIAGDFPSINRIQQELRIRNGSPGSTVVVTRLLTEWRTSLSLKIKDDCANPPEEDLHALARALAHQATKIASDAFAVQVEAITADHSKETSALRSQIDEAHSQAQAFIHQIEQANQKISDLQKEQSQQALAMRALLEKATALEDQVSNHLLTIDSKSSEISSLMERIEEEAQNHGYQIQGIEEAHQAHIQSLASSHSNDIAQLNQSHLAALDALELKHAVETNKFRESESAQRRIDLTRIDAAETKVSSLEKQLHKQKEQSQKDSLDLKSQIAVLQAELLAEKRLNELLSRSASDLSTRLDHLAVIIAQQQVPVLPEVSTEDSSKAGQILDGSKND